MERVAFIDPGNSKFRVDLKWFVVAPDSLLVLAEVMERAAFMIPCIIIIQVDLKCLVVAPDRVVSG